MFGFDSRCNEIRVVVGSLSKGPICRVMPAPRREHKFSFREPDFIKFYKRNRLNIASNNSYLEILTTIINNNNNYYYYYYDNDDDDDDDGDGGGDDDDDYFHFHNNSNNNNHNNNNYYYYCITPSRG